MRAGELIDSVKNENVSKTELAEMMIEKVYQPHLQELQAKQNKYDIKCYLRIC